MGELPPQPVPDGKVPGEWVPAWKTDGPFLPLVNTFSAALSAIAVLADPAIQLPRAPYGLKFNGRVLESIQVHIDQARARWQRELSQNHHVVADFFEGLTCMLINAAYEAVKETLDGDTHELIQFFRHVRNGCSHRNRFLFRANEPRHPARWRGLEIDHTKKGDSNLLQGAPVIGKTGLLYSADPVLLLADVEKLRFGGSGGRMALPDEIA